MNSNAPAIEAQTLLTRIAEGSEAAMKQFFDQYADLIYRHIIAKSGDVSLASEILNEVMLHVWRKPQSFEGRAKPSTWLIAIARNKLVDHYRKHNRVDLTELDDTLEDDSATAVCTIAQEQHAQYLRNCMEKLKADQREIVHLAFFEDMSYPDIAEAVNCPVGTIKSRIYHIKEKLRQCVQRLTQGEITHDYV